MKKPTDRKKKPVRPRVRAGSRDTLRPEYEFRGGIRGKYSDGYAGGTNLVLLDPDVAAEFVDAKAVNRALRAYLKARSKRRSA